MKTKYTIKCNVTGLDLVRTPNYLKEQIQKYKFDSIDSLRGQYIGRVGRKLLKEGKSVDEIRNQFNCDIKTPISTETLIRFKVQKTSSTSNLRTEKKPSIKTVDPENQPF
jgi:hypothetical protein